MRALICVCAVLLGGAPVRSAQAASADDGATPGRGEASDAAPSIEPAKGREALRILRAIPVQHEGRWCPADTVARDMVRQVTGHSRWRGRDAMLTLIDWTFRHEAASQERVIAVSSGEVRKLIGLPAERERFSLDFLQSHAGFNERIRAVMQKRRQRQPVDALDGKVEDIGDRMSTLVSVLNDRVIRPIPDAKDERGRWLSISEAWQVEPARVATVQKAWVAVGLAYVEGRGEALISAARSLTDGLGELEAAYRPQAEEIALELRQNRLDPFGRGWVLAWVCAALALAAMVVQRRAMDVVVWLMAAVTFGLVTYGLGVRWELADRIPAANMYESMLFMGWGLCLATLTGLVTVRHRLVTFLSSLLAALSLMLADVLSIDPVIRPVAPVLLDTAWMAIHVPVIMVSYSVLLIAMGFGLALLGMFALAPHRVELIDAADHLHYRFIQVGALLLTIGIITGSMWGSASWGRYWGWDPKEVWSLIAMLGYLAILHARATGWLRAFGTALASTLVFWLVVMTYVGVNYILGIGLHSYAFGKGAVATWCFLVGGVQLVLTTAVVMAHLGRRRTAGPGD